jgi:hypothetical protein
LPGTISLELFKAVSRRHPKIHQVYRLIQIRELSPGDGLDIASEFAYIFTFKNLPRVAAREAYYHGGILSRRDTFATGNS